VIESWNCTSLLLLLESEEEEEALNIRSFENNDAPSRWYEEHFEMLHESTSIRKNDGEVEVDDDTNNPGNDNICSAGMTPPRPLGAV